jgi:oligoribonuclease
VIAIHQSQQKLDAMDEWNQRQHGNSGLIERVQQSEYDEARAEAETLEFLQNYLPSGASPMCGNSICQDRRFLARTMPRLEAFFHYRNLDVSTLKELMNRWAPSLNGGFSKQGKHLALDDVRDSIYELRYYRDHFLRLP